MLVKNELMLFQVLFQILLMLLSMLLIVLLIQFHVDWPKLLIPFQTLLKNELIAFQPAFQALPILLSVACNAAPIVLIKLINTSHKPCQICCPNLVCVKNQIRPATTAAITATSAPIGFMFITTLKAACTAVAIFVTVDQIAVATCTAFIAPAQASQIPARGVNTGARNLTTCKTPFSKSSTTFNATARDLGGNSVPHPPTILNTSLKISHNDCHIALNDSNTPTFCIAVKSFPNQSTTPLIAADNGACIEFVRFPIASAIALIA